MKDIALILMGVLMGCYMATWADFACSRSAEPSAAAPDTDTVTVTVMRIDTVMVECIKEVERYALRRDTVRLPLVVCDTVVDTVAVEVPIERKVYADTNYRAVISGYRPSLDSLEIYSRTVERTITIPAKPRRWAIGISAGVGLTPKGVQPYIGAGVTYNISM